MIPLSDALYILAGTNAAMLALGWWGRRAVGHAEWQEGYAEGTQDERAYKISKAWDEEFSQPDLNDFVDGVLKAPDDDDPRGEPPVCSGCATDRHCFGAACRCPCGMEPAGWADPIEGTVMAPGAGRGLAVPRLRFEPEPWTILDADPTTSERLATVAEVRDDADYWLWRTEMAALIDGAAQWYDEEFHTGTFRAVR
jgi:hypothetical protein